jgi:hypothetical protein
LEGRSAFCRRDVSHQLATQRLSLADINKNRLTFFVSAIVESRDWCGYWGIDQYKITPQKMAVQGAPGERRLFD